jgi:hypothetical protein
MLVRQFDVAQFASRCHIRLFCKVHAHWPLCVDICFSFLLWLSQLPFFSFSSRFTKNALHPHSTLLSAVRSKSPSPYWLYAPVESASCPEYKLYSVTCKRFSVHWVNQTTVSTPVWSVFWLTVRSDIDLRFTRFCVLNCCVQLRKVKGDYDFGKQRQAPPRWRRTSLHSYLLLPCRNHW